MLRDDLGGPGVDRGIPVTPERPEVALVVDVCPVACVLLFEAPRQIVPIDPRSWVVVARLHPTLSALVRLSVVGRRDAAGPEEGEQVVEPKRPGGGRLVAR